MSRLKTIALQIMTGRLPEVATEDLVRARLQECEACPSFTQGRRCKECGCFMDLKTQLLHASCPLNKW